MLLSFHSSDLPVLHSPASFPNDLLLLLEALIEQVNLQGEGVLGHVLVKVCQVDVVYHRLVVHRKTKFFRQGCSKCAFTFMLSRREGDWRRGNVSVGVASDRIL